MCLQQIVTAKLRVEKSKKKEQKTAGKVKGTFC